MYTCMQHLQCMQAAGSVLASFPGPVFRDGEKLARLKEKPGPGNEAKYVLYYSCNNYWGAPSQILGAQDLLLLLHCSNFQERSSNYFAEIIAKVDS